MITLDGVVILSDVYTMLVDLRNDLHLNGINLLNDVKTRESTKDVMITCPNPNHKGGQERKPSCGVAKTDVIRNGKQHHAGTVHCFQCGYTADFFDFVSHCWGTNDRNYGRRYIIRKYNTMELSERPDLKLNFDRKRPGQLPYSYIDESVLDNYRFTSDYLYARNFDLNTILFYEYGLNTMQNTITMPVRDHKGGLVFVKQRLLNPPPDGNKYLNETGIPKQYILYGFYHVLQLIEAINKGVCNNKKLEENYKRYGVFLTEGEFNASYLMQNGYPAVSLLGRILFEDRSKKTVQQKELLMRYGIRQLVPWMDNDGPGQEAQAKLKEQLQGNFILRQPDYSMFPDLNDANNYTPDQLDALRFINL
jgi:hypothetical protein